MFKVLKPKPGVKVHNPATMLFLPEQGTEVAITNYWLRRIKDGSVSEVLPVKKTKKKVNKKIDKSMEGVK